MAVIDAVLRTQDKGERVHTAKRTIVVCGCVAFALVLHVLFCKWTKYPEGPIIWVVPASVVPLSDYILRARFGNTADPAIGCGIILPLVLFCVAAVAGKGGGRRRTGK